MISAWIITDEGKIGTEKQCLALAKALGISPLVYRIQSRWPWTWLPPRLWCSPLRGISPFLSAPWPSLVIGAGRRSAAPVAEIKRLSQGKTFTIFIQNPKMPLNLFDVVLAPFHDHLKGKNVIPTTGALCDPFFLEEKVNSPEREGPRPWGALLLGGGSHHFKMTEDWQASVVEGLVRWYSRQGGGLWMTPSRRTPNTFVEALKKKLSFSYEWDGKGENPYISFLQKADYFIVTGDSVSMISEVMGTGKPLFIIPGSKDSRKLTEFHHFLVDKGIARFFDPEWGGDFWSYAPLQETKSCAETIRLLLSQRKDFFI